jgi:1-deoxy-D-xylulose-5-phosphate reductoisomerase
LLNKGLEVIEAHLLFDVPFDAIDVVVHPQSYVHSMVEFSDGSTLAQASPPDMALAIALALSWPDRLPDVAPALDWSSAMSWDFEPLDDKAFPAVGLARAAGRLGGTAPAVLNAANEECVAAFLDGRLAFPAIVSTVSRVLAEYGVPSDPGALSVADVLAAESWARERARRISGSRPDQEATQP